MQIIYIIIFGVKKGYEDLSILDRILQSPILP